MSRISLFNSPFLVGFDQLERVMDAVAKSASDGYPPYTIEHLDDRALRITLAVAGFAAEDLSVTVEDNQLIIRGKQQEGGDKAYLHRGIAARQFLRKFVLAEGMDVTAAHLDNGLLNVDLQRPEPDTGVRTIAIVEGPPPSPHTVIEGD